MPEIYRKRAVWEIDDHGSFDLAHPDKFLNDRPSHFGPVWQRDDGVWVGTFRDAHMLDHSGRNKHLKTLIPEWEG